MLNQNYLLLLILFPFLSAILIPFVKNKAVSWASMGFAATYFLICLGAWNQQEMTFMSAWFKPLGLSYSLLLDSYSYLLILLSAFLTLVCVGYSHGVVTEKTKAYHSLFHLLQGTVVACLLSEDLIFFYVFWEAMLIPMYFIIGIWGGPRRVYASLKFFIYTFAGSILMLIGLISLYVIYFQSTGQWTASFTTLQEYFSQNPLPLSIQQFLFLSMVISFAIKVPLFPFHTWLPDAHTEAPTAGSVILAGVLLKMGTYGLMRFAIPLFPEAAMSLASPLCALSVAGIIIGAVIAWRQTDIKKLVAYSSVSHLGFVSLGIFMMTEVSWNGAYLQMINHGISTGALFLLIGFLYDQKHTRDIDAFGGLAKLLPAFSIVYVMVMLSSVGLPGTNGFVGEFMILLGSFQSSLASEAWVVVATGGVILGAVYMLHLTQKLLYGASPVGDEGLYDFRLREWLIYLPLLILIFSIGFYPSWLLDSIEQTTSKIFISIPENWR
jgi:NADH-quinone oxidoreductase subunit M